jgi:hypothetical protein
VIHSDNGRWLGTYAELMEDRRREHERDLRQQQDGRSAGEIRSTAEAIADEELSRHLIVTPEMAGDSRRADRFWRNADGTWRWRGDDEIGPPEPEPVKGCPCGGEVIRDPYGGWTCRSCNTALLESQLVEMGEPKPRPWVRVSRPSSDELRARGVIV